VATETKQNSPGKRQDGEKVFTTGQKQGGCAAKGGPLEGRERWSKFSGVVGGEKSWGCRESKSVKWFKKHWGFAVVMVMQNVGTVLAYGTGRKPEGTGKSL